MYKDGKEMDMKLRIEKGEVIDLTVNGNKVPEKDWGKYQDEIDETFADVRKIEETLMKQMNSWISRISKR